MSELRERETSTVAAIQGYDPRTGQPVGDPVPATTPEQVATTALAAGAAAVSWAAWPATRRADALDAVAAALDDAVDQLVAVADAETALGDPRLRGEVARTTGQLRMFGDLLRRGEHVDAILSPADPGAGRPDVRRMLRPIGPVAVFSASNFPFAFSVAGGDTASALAAGCPVVVKAHEAHPGTSVATASVVTDALRAAGAPDGTFALVTGFDAGPALVRHPAIRAIGFTGSLAGGRALYDLAQSRPDPIPFFGELGSVNPVVVLPGAAAERPDEIASGYLGSLTLGAGQFCTNPGLLFVPESAAGLLATLAEQLAGATAGPMLSEKIHRGYAQQLATRTGLTTLAAGSAEATGAAGTAGAPDIAGTAGTASTAGSAGATGTTGATGTAGAGGTAGMAGTAEAAGAGPWVGAPMVWRTSVEEFAGRPELAEEVFGPAGLVVTYRDPDEMAGALAVLPGSLTGSVHAVPADHDHARKVAATLAPRAGRLIFNGWPTGVTVCWAMHHGGPWPASTATAYTSVGATAIRRWLVPIAYQDWPDELLPPELAAANPLDIPRLTQPT
ncbi:MAG: aldehyde dehydrogenase (NADP(+)) [Micromonosporaceae bacterium]